MNGAYFLDSSALVKRYIHEDATPWIRSITDPRKGNLIIISSITLREIIHALLNCQRNGSISLAQVKKVLHALNYHLDTQYQIVELDQMLVDTEISLARTYLLNINGAIQLASVLRIKEAFDMAAIPLFFVSVDEQLLAAARNEGLQILNLKPSR